jgi:hypothetical protein
MSTLAKELKVRGITLVDPLVAAAAKAKKAGVAFDDCGEDSDFEFEEEVEKSTPKTKKATPSRKKAFKSPSLKSPSLKSPPLKSPPLKSPPLRSPAFNQVTPRMSSKKASYSVDDLTSDFSAQIIQGFLDEGLSSMEYGGHVEFGAGISVPYLIGGWGEQVVDPLDDWSHITKKYTIIRLIPTQGFSLKSLELKWVDAQTLKLIIPWPTWFSQISNQVGLQEGEEKGRVFDSSHKAMESMRNNKKAKVEDPNAPRERKRIVDNGCFQFERPMKTGKTDIETAMIRIPITDKDIDKTKGEALPEGGFVRVLQMILTEETPDAEDSGDSPIRFNATSRTAKLGKLIQMFFACDSMFDLLESHIAFLMRLPVCDIILYYISISHFYSFLILYIYIHI